MRLILVVPARISSQRLRGKVLKKITKNKNILDLIASRVRNIKGIYKMIIATSNINSDNRIENYCKKNNITCFRGSLKNVAKRILDVAIKYKAEGIIIIRGDSPLIDFRIINKCILLYKKKNCDLVTNTFPRSFPIGQSVEIIKTRTLKNNFFKFIKKRFKEHITNFFYENHGKFKIINLKNKINLKNYSLAVDTNEDFIKIKKICTKLKKNKFASLSEIMKISKKLQYFK